MIGVLVVAAFAYYKVPQVQEQRAHQSEIAQLIQDEGFVPKVYRDSLGYATIGFGHLVLPGEKFDTITPQQGIEMLRHDYALARANVEKRYPWAQGDVKLVLINMSYQLGPSRLAKFEKALNAMEAGDYDTAAAELLDSAWAKQTPKRAQRLSGRILQLGQSWW